MKKANFCMGNGPDFSSAPGKIQFRSGGAGAAEEEKLVFSTRKTGERGALPDDFFQGAGKSVVLGEITWYNEQTMSDAPPRPRGTGREERQGWHRKRRSGSGGRIP